MTTIPDAHDVVHVPFYDGETIPVQRRPDGSVRVGYSKIDPRPNFALTPQLMVRVMVTVRGQRRWLRTNAQVDSGADVTALPIDWAEHLGVDLSKATRQRVAFAGRPDENDGISDHSDGEYWKVTREQLVVEVEGLGCRVVLRDPCFGHFPRVLLGRADFFRRFLVTFDERAQAFELAPYRRSGA